MSTHFLYSEFLFLAAVAGCFFLEIWAGTRVGGWRFGNRNQPRRPSHRRCRAELHFGRSPEYPKRSRPGAIHHAFARKIAHSFSSLGIGDELSNRAGEIFDIMRFRD